VGGVDLFQTRGQFLSVWECSLILSEKSFEFVPFVPYLAGVVEVQIVGVAIPILVVK